MNEVLELIRRSIVFFGQTTDSHHFTGTGCIMTLNGVNHVVTAKHVVIDDNGLIKNLNIFVNDNQGILSIINIKEIKDRLETEWITHENNEIDLAVMPFPKHKETSTKVLPRKLFTTIEEISLLDEVFFLSYQPNIIIERVDPIARAGSVSFISSNKTFYIDGTVFPGNSGSPVFIKPSPYYMQGRQYQFSANPLSFHFIGIINSYLPYVDIAYSLQTKMPRIYFMENTGLSIVSSWNLIDEISQSKKCKSQSERVIRKFGKNES